MRNHRHAVLILPLDSKQQCQRLGSQALCRVYITVYSTQHTILLHAKDLKHTACTSFSLDIACSSFSLESSGLQQRPDAARGARKHPRTHAGRRRSLKHNAGVPVQPGHGW